MNRQEIKEQRKKHNMTQRELAIAVGLSSKNGDVTIRRIENGSIKQPTSLLLQTALKLFFENLELKKGKA